MIGAGLVTAEISPTISSSWATEISDARRRAGGAGGGDGGVERRGLLAFHAEPLAREQPEERALIGFAPLPRGRGVLRRQKANRLLLANIFALPPARERRQVVRREAGQRLLRVMPGRPVPVPSALEPEHAVVRISAASMVSRKPKGTVPRSSPTTRQRARRLSSASCPIRSYGIGEIRAFERGCAFRDHEQARSAMA